MLLFGNVEECYALDLGILFFSLSYLFTCCFILCDEYFIPSLNYIGNKLSLSSDIQGATLMAMGSSTPEFFTALIAIFLYSDNMDLNPAPSTIVGSSMFNAAFVMGLYVIISNTVYTDKYKQTSIENIESNNNINGFALYRDIITYIIAVIALYIFYDISSPKQMSGFEGLCLILIWIIYVIVLSNSSKCNHLCQCHKNQILLQQIEDDTVIIVQNDNDDNNKQKRSSPIPFVSILNDFYEIFYSKPIHKLFSYILPIPHHIEYDTLNNTDDADISLMELESEYLSDFPLPNNGNIDGVKVNDELFTKFLLTFILSILWMSVITYFLLSAVTTIGNCLNISASIMGMTVIAIGSSLPDTLTSIIFAKKYGNNKIDMIISNCFSSNTFNICFVLGMTFLLKYLLSTQYDENEHNIDTTNALGLMLIQIFTSLLFLIMMHLNNLKLRLIHGAIMITMYFLFIILFVIYGQ